MANEATLIYELEPAVPYTCSNSTGIEKGTLCKLTDPATAIISSAAGDYCCGICKTEKIANDGKTKISIYGRGIFKMYASGSITAGNPLMSAADANFPNYVKVATAATTCSGASLIGHALETATAGETFLVYLNIGTQ